MNLEKRMRPKQLSTAGVLSDETVIYMSYRSVLDHPIYPLHLHLIECLALKVVRRRCMINQGENEVSLSVVSGFTIRHLAETIELKKDLTVKVHTYCRVCL